jgi:hypothetical protein
MVLLYDEPKMELLEKNIDSIIMDARRYALDTILEPNLEEWNSAMKILLDFIKSNGRIIYGGYGWNELIKKKNKDHALYSEDMIELPDIEFYSPTPVHDLVILCKEYVSKGFKFVRGEEAQHHETYTIFVNQHQYCDISYMPKILFNKMPLMKVNNLNISHPKFILIDIMRMYNDPMTSYWRVKKSLQRANILLKHYPLDTRGKLNKIDITDEIQKNLDFVRKNIIIGSKLLVFGYYGYQYYMYKGSNDTKEELYVPYYDVISTNFENDVKIIKETLQTYNDNITVEEYHPFFQFLDKSVSFKYKGKPLLNVYGNNSMCIPYWYIEKKKINVVTFPYMILTLLIMHIYYLVNGDKILSQNYDYLLEEIIKIRNNYLEKNNKTILDNTPFQEFRIQCMGETMDSSRKYRLMIAEKIANKQRIKFKYDPYASNDKFRPDAFKFDNSSGNLNTSKNRIFY